MNPSFIRQALLCCALLFPAVVPAASVNVNAADAATLVRELKGIGLKRAQAIVDYRSKNGPFKSADELALVKGIGPKFIVRNRADIRTDAGRPAASAPGKAATAVPAPAVPAAPIRR
jgi:competence protein ComEA